MTTLPAPQPGPGRPLNLLVTGLVRNCGAVVRDEIGRLGRAVQELGLVRWLVIESDSSDDSLVQLQRLADERRDFRFLSLGHLRGTRPLRTDRLAACRNRYLEEIDCNPAYSDVDHVVVADLDGFNTHLTPAAMRSCWDRCGWDVCTANQAGPYSDVWALRHPLWSPNDCYKAFDHMRSHGVGREKALYAAVHVRMLRIPENSDWIEVDSAFGGLAVYRRAALAGLRYVGLDEHGEEICEHVTLHSAMRARGARLFVNPRLVNAGYTEHTAQKRLTAKALRVATRPFVSVYRFVQPRHARRPKP